MRTGIVVASIMALSQALMAQVPQEKKPVPKDSVRVSVSGCTKGYIFTAGPAMRDVVAGLDIRPGMHLRMNGPKKVIAAIDAYRSSMIEITGIMRKGQSLPDGVAIGGAVRLAPASPGGSNGPGNSISGPVQIDVEGWNPATGTCPAQ